MLAELVIATALAQIAGAPVVCQSGDRNFYDLRTAPPTIVLELRLCKALAIAPMMPRTRAAHLRVAEAVFLLAHEAAHVEQDHAQAPFDEFEADCRAAATFGRYAYAVGVRGRAVMQRMVSLISGWIGYAPKATRESGCWGAWRR